MKVKRFFGMFLALIQVLLCVGCGGSSQEPEDETQYTYLAEIPEYSDETKELELLAFWSPPSTEEHYQWMVDCGFTSVVIDSKYGNQIDSDTLMKTLELCDQVGIGAYPAVNRGRSTSSGVDYSQFESFRGFYTDEPLSKEDLLSIEENASALTNAYPDQNYTYLTTLINGSPSPKYNMDFNDFEDYVNFYMEHGGKEQKAFLFDIYPLRGTSLKGDIEPRWLEVLEAMTATAEKNGMELWPYIATMSFRSGTRRRPAEDDLRYQAYVNLAYGAKGIAYFCYMTPGLPPYDGEFVLADWALINYEDPDDISTYYRTDTWYSTQKVNKELKAFDHVLLSFDWVGVMKTMGSEAATSAGKNCFPTAKNVLKSHDGIRSFTSTEDSILGVFKDENGYDGFLLVNFSDPLYDCQDTVQLQFRGASRALVYIKGEQQLVELTDGTYSVTLEPGEGQFIIPLA